MKKEQSAFGWITAFAVLGNIRRQGLAKLARMPLGDVQAKGSATLLPVLPIGGLLLKSGTLTPEKFVLIVILSMGLITPIIGCMKFTDDLAKVGTIIGQVTDILTAQELPCPVPKRTRRPRRAAPWRCTMSTLAMVIRRSCTAST